MAEKTDIRTLITIETENEGVKKAQQALKEVIKRQADLSAAFKAGTKDAKTFNSEMAELIKQEREYAKAIDAVTDKIEEKLSAQEKFDITSQNVALAGDVESGLRTIGGAAGAFGAGGAEQVLGKGGEIFATIEALPRLKAAAAGLPDVLSATASSLGTSVVGLGALGAGLAAFFVVLEIGRRAAEESRKAIQADFNALEQRNAIAAEATTLTTEEAEAKRQAAEASVALAKTNYDQARAIQEQLDSQNLLIRGFGEASSAIGVGNQAYGETAKRVEDTEAALKVARAELEGWTTAIDENVTAAQDAAEAEKKLADERTQATLDQAAAAGELASLQAEVSSLTKQDIERQLSALDKQKAGIQAQIKVLAASGDTSEKAADKLKELQSTLALLGDKAGILTQALPSARDLEAEKAAEEAKREAERKQKERQREAEQARKERERESEAARKANEAAAKKALDEQNKFQEDLAKIRNDGQEALRKLSIDHNRELEDIQRSYDDSREDALQEGNFLSLRNLNKESLRAERDAGIDRKRTEKDLREEAARATQELLQKRLQEEAKAYDGSLQQARHFATAFPAALNAGIERALQDLNGRINPRGGGTRFNRPTSERFYKDTPRTRSA